MTLEGSVRELRQRLSVAVSRVDDLDGIADPPNSGTVPLAVEEFRDATLEFHSRLADALAAVLPVADDAPPTDDGIRRDVTICQGNFTDASRFFNVELDSPERIHDLMSLGETEGDEGQQWRWWFRAVRNSLTQCEGAMFDAAEALAACWVELASRIPSTSVAMQVTNIGNEVALDQDARPRIGSEPVNR